MKEFPPWIEVVRPIEFHEARGGVAFRIEGDHRDPDRIACSFGKERFGFLDIFGNNRTGRWAVRKEHGHDTHFAFQRRPANGFAVLVRKSEEHTSELQSRQYLVSRLLL